MNFAKFLRKPFSKNTSGGLFLIVVECSNLKLQHVYCKGVIKVGKLELLSNSVADVFGIKVKELKFIDVEIH